MEKIVFSLNKDNILCDCYDDSGENIKFNSSSSSFPFELMDICRRKIVVTAKKNKDNISIKYNDLEIVIENVNKFKKIPKFESYISWLESNMAYNKKLDIEIISMIIAGLFSLTLGISKLSNRTEKPNSDTLVSYTDSVSSMDLPDDNLLIYNESENINDTINLEVGSRYELEKAKKTRELYGDIITKYANQYGLDPNLMIAIATQERGVHSTEVDSGGAIGLMQIQVSVWNGETIVSYNYESYQNEKVTITLEKLKNVDFCCQVGCMIFQNYLKQMQGNIIAAIQCYNYGPGNMGKVLNSCTNETRMEKEDILDCNCISWLPYVSCVTQGDPEYVKHVLSYFPNDIPIKFINPQTKEICISSFNTPSRTY